MSPRWGAFLDVLPVRGTQICMFPGLGIGYPRSGETATSAEDFNVLVAFAYQRETISGHSP